MDADWSSFLSREDLLGGLPARRASTLLFAIESHTAQLVARSRKAMAAYLTEGTAEQQERAFIAALAEGRDLPLEPSIQDLERYSHDWADLVPPDAGVRAALGRLIGEKHPLPEHRVPGISAALGLGDPAVAERFQQLHGRPLETIFADRLPGRQRLRWLRASLSARLENLPPFWMAFALTLTETVGAGILALPIAFAALGPIAGVVALVVLGLVNLLTLAAMAEAVARNGNVRFGRAYFSRLVSDYLGRPGLLVLTPALLMLYAVILLTYFIGLSSVLTDAIGLRPEIWAILLIVTILYFLRRETLDATVASAMLVGATSISLIVILSLIALPHVSGANLRHAELPFRNGQPFDISVLELIFGVVLLAYSGHTTTVNCAAVVLAKEPSGRALIKGSAAAIAAAMSLYCLWVIAVGGAVSPTELAGETGTSLAPLAATVGPSVHIFGVVFAVLAMGMASIHISLGLLNQVKEWLPNLDDGESRDANAATLLAPNRRGRLLTVTRSRRGQVILGLLPAIAIFLLAEWLFVTDQESFAALLGFVGVLTAPIVAGVFSMLMLYAARRKGDCAVGSVWRLLDHPLVTIGACGLFLASIVVHWLFVWDDPFRRVTGLVVTVIMVGFLIAIRSSAFIPRAVVELRLGHEARSAAELNLVAPGNHRPPMVEWTTNGRHPSGFASDPGVVGGATVQIQPLAVQELKVWTHRLTPDGGSEGLDAHLTVASGSPEHVKEFRLPGGLIVVPVDGAAARLVITLADETTPRTLPGGG